MKGLILIFALFFCFLGNAQNEAIFNRATDAYNEGDYQQAISFYDQILEKGEHSAALYFNLGNSYYKLNQIAPSIYYYEKALLLKPEDAEIKTNLAYAQNMTLDAIEVLPETGLSKIYQRITGRMSFDQWAYTAVVFLVLFVLGYLGFYFLQYATQKRIALISSLTFLMVSFIAILFAFMQYSQFKAEQPAIIFSEVVSVKSEPNNRSGEAFVLHEGTKVNVLEQLNDYRKIQLVDGKIGWIPSDDIKLLKDF
ncbi:tetratricopeptide repeat protein [Muriicola sp. Z0-33]|uniref:tetratricopeptide repeat protein n=1 Tax=Muriicola sp. Z0-33 TaxID=2816957 RepID=UPI0022383A44|nr:tetratricopeptide repeat protein [Muriicola sp. Z0-33]MCW5514849.1 tetratricopeptide repeat protein [Muriicola sp. Z0-33]